MFKCNKLLLIFSFIFTLKSAFLELFGCLTSVFFRVLLFFGAKIVNFNS